MRAYEVPEGFTVYERKYPGYMVRVAVTDEQIRIDPTLTRHTLSKDQTSPVYEVMIRQADGTIEHTGKEIDTIPAEARAGAQRVAEERMGIAKAQKERSKTFLFAEAHAKLVLEGKVPDEVAEFRLTICTGVTKDGDVVSDKCPNYVRENSARGSGHCEGCGCPKWKVAEMHRPKDNGKGEKFFPGKAHYPMGCPQGRFAAQPGRRARAASV